MLWWNENLKCYCLPFMGADKSIVQRSQYFDATMNQAYPVSFFFHNLIIEFQAAIETYICVQSWFWAVALMLWLYIFNIAVQYDFTRAILQKYPGFCSGYMFKESGPTREQAKQVNFSFIIRYIRIYSNKGFIRILVLWIWMGPGRNTIE